MGLFKDMALSAIDGTISLGESVVGFSDLFSDGMVSRGLNKIGYDPQKTHKIINNQFSDQFKQSSAEYQDHNLWWQAAQMLRKPDPYYLMNKSISMLPSAAAAISLGGPAKSVLRQAIGPGIITAGNESRKSRTDSTNFKLTPYETAEVALKGGIDAVGSYGGAKLLPHVGLNRFSDLFPSTSITPRKHISKILLGGAGNEFGQELIQDTLTPK